MFIYTTNKQDIKGESGLRDFFKASLNIDQRLVLRWYFWLSGVLGEVVKSVKISKIKGCGTTFKGLCTCLSDRKEGV